VAYQGADALAGATPAWEACLTACPETLVFSRPAWADAWLAVYGRRRTACIVVVTADGQPEAVFPLQTSVVPVLGLRRLEFIGGSPPTWRQWALNPDGLGQVIYAGGVIVPGEEDGALRALRGWLDAGAGRWDMVRLNCVPADSPLAHDHWPLGPAWRCQETTQVKHRIDLTVGWDTWMATISKRQRRHLNYEPHALTRAAGGQLELDEVRGGGVAAAMEEYLELNRVRWAALQRPGILAGDVALYRRLAGDPGSGMVFYRLTAGGRLLACQFGFDHGGRYLIYGLTFDPSFERQSPSQVLMHFVIRRCFDDGHREVDLGALRMVEQWTRDTRFRAHLTAVSRRPAARARVAALAGGGRAVHAAQESPTGKRVRAAAAKLAASRRPAPAGSTVSGAPAPAAEERDLEGAKVTVIVPTFNSASVLGACLKSLRRQSEPCRIVVIDNHSTDGTTDLAAVLADDVVTAGPERSAQRNLGARRATTPYIGFIDSDMVVSERVVEEAAGILEGDTGAVIVPERSVGSGFWAAVRQFERSFYVGSDTVEAARFFRRDVFEATGGFDDSFVGGEDWDLHLRAAKLTTMSRTTSTIDHDESGLRLRETCAKKAYYAAGLRVFAAKHGADALTAAVFDRAYLRRPWKLVYPHPVLGVGLVALKGAELLAVGAGLARSRPR
jgi:arabinofuranan 3-O-arabinosyltransferase